MVADAWQRRGLGTLLLRELAGRAADVGINQFTAEILTEYAPTLALLQQLGAADMTRDGSTVAIAIDAKKPMLAKDIGASSLFCRPARMAPDGGQGAARRPRAGRGDGHAGDKGALRRRRSAAPSRPASRRSADRRPRASWNSSWSMRATWPRSAASGERLNAAGAVTAGR